ncbi:MAG: nucleoside 2-deoxyribosyltransferase domain-containing protein [bacterium]|nr:nucleoside 2-deoxyribosyltransferase domain-containing protein [bacterium]
MNVIYARQPFPLSFTKSIFLAGPTPRTPDVTSWRREALMTLAMLGYDGVVFVPEDQTWATFSDAQYIEQVDWEQDAMRRSDIIVFWVPRDLTTLPGFTTNVEFGLWAQSGKVLFGGPDAETPKNRYLETLAAPERFAIPVFHALEDVLRAAIDRTSDGALRTGGECCVPLSIWKSATFQQWYAQQRRAGNILIDARMDWVHLRRNEAILWALRVTLHIAVEDRDKREVVIGRPPTVCAVLYRRHPTLMDTAIVLVREQRPAAATRDGYVWELPGGTVDSGTFDTICVEGGREAEEETGLPIDPKRLRLVGIRQAMGTLSAHRGACVAAELTDAEIEWVRGQAGVAHGLAEHTERTFPEVRTIGEILREDLVDWSALGMIFAALEHRE